MYTATDIREERDSPRYRLKLELDLTTQGETSVALIHDLSRSGMRLESNLDLAVGDIIEVELTESEQVTATVVRCDGNMFGCEFPTQLTAGAVSSAQLRSEFLDKNDGSMSGQEVEEVRVGQSLNEEELRELTKLRQGNGTSERKVLIGFRKDDDGTIIALFGSPG